MGAGEEFDFIIRNKLDRRYKATGKLTLEILLKFSEEIILGLKGLFSRSIKTVFSFCFR